MTNLEKLYLFLSYSNPTYDDLAPSLYDNFKKVHRSFYLAYYMEDGCKKASTVPFLASNVKNLASSFLKVKEYVEVF